MAKYVLIRDSFDEESGEMETKTKTYPTLDSMLQIVCNVMNAPRKNGYLKIMSVAFVGDDLTITIEQQPSDYIKKKMGL